MHRFLWCRANVISFQHIRGVLTLSRQFLWTTQMVSGNVLIDIFTRNFAQRGPWMWKIQTEIYFSPYVKNGFHCSEFYKIHTQSVNFFGYLLYTAISKSDKKIICVGKISCACITKFRSTEWHYVELLLAKCNTNWLEIWKLYAEMDWQPCENFDYHCAYIHASHAWDLRSSGILHKVDFLLVTDVSGQRIGPIFKGQVIHPRISSWIA